MDVVSSCKQKCSFSHQITTSIIILLREENTSIKKILSAVWFCFHIKARSVSGISVNKNEIDAGSHLALKKLDLRYKMQ